ARPFLEESFILSSLEALDEKTGGVIGVPLKDTLKETDRSGFVVQTHERDRFWLSQTPQTFRYSEILEAYRSCNPPPYPTDDGAVLEMQGGRIKMVQGSYLNMKLTTPEDWMLAEAILRLQQDAR
ncbi:MAG: IspD/TarI family cytidylyltransferase, partial [Candidatus Hinthialibacter sp.]